MSLQAPPRLLQSAVQSLLREHLLRDKAVAIPALNKLPVELFPLLFMVALTEGRSKTLTAMVQACPFLRLPLGVLMKMLHLETLSAVLDGLDVLLAQKVRPSGWELQVLDLREVDENFWSMWSGAPVRSSRAKRKLLEFLTYLFEWGQLRKDLVHLCCKEAVFFVSYFYELRQFLEIVDLNCIQDMEVHTFWDIGNLGQFVPYLAQMRSVRTVIFSDVHRHDYDWRKAGKEIMTEFTSTFFKLDKLQKLSLYRVCFLEHYLDHTHQLKELDLSGIILSNFNPEPFQTLLENVAATLQVLILEDCWITDFQLSVILPALSRCHQLITFNFRGNQISEAILETLFCHTVKLSSLSLEIYPVPDECYTDMDPEPCFQLQG
ncbi:PRAME family member 12-like [Eulemur rufifrons]|uniref:PRAME family member 12-like n=1 Tax=Eulemur rufifrons TaxID=859984 RepID=UPI0037427017